MLSGHNRGARKGETLQEGATKLMVAIRGLTKGQAGALFQL